MKHSLCPVPSCHSYGRYCRLHSVNSPKNPKPIPTKSKKAAQSERQYNKVAREFKKAHPSCQAQLIGCTRQTTDVHHMKGRAKEELTDERFFLAVCRNCHRAIEDNPGFAKERGFSISRHKKTA